MRPVAGLALCCLLAGCRCGAEAGSAAEASPRTDCGPGDLVLFADVRARAGKDTPLTSRERLYLGVVIGNPCAVPIAVDTAVACLVHEFALSDASGLARRGGPACAAQARRWVVAPRGAETMTFDLGTLDAGSYEVSVPFTFTTRTATAVFAVLE